MATSKGYRTLTLSTLEIRTLEGDVLQRQPLGTAEARDERTLFPVGCTPLLGASAAAPPHMWKEQASPRVFCVYVRSGSNCLNAKKFADWLKDNHFDDGKPIAMSA